MKWYVPGPTPWTRCLAAKAAGRDGSRHIWTERGLSVTRRNFKLGIFGHNLWVLLYGFCAREVQCHVAAHQRFICACQMIN